MNIVAFADIFEVEKLKEIVLSFVKDFDKKEQNKKKLVINRNEK